MSQYNHVFSLAFSLNTNDEEGLDIDPGAIRAAIQHRLDSLTDEELPEAIGAPEDTITLSN